MKTAAKVFIILGMVFGAIAILPLIFGGITLSKMKTANSKSDMMIWGILDIFFVGLIGGILILCVSDEEWANKYFLTKKHPSARFAEGCFFI